MKQTLLKFVTVMLTALLSMPVFAESTSEEINGIHYYYYDYGDSKEAAVAYPDYDFEPVDLVIPATVTIDGVEYKVTEISYGAFRDCTSLKSIVLPHGVTNIDDSAFDGCTNLESIVLPNGLSKICEHTFDGCTNLESIVLPDGLTEIENSAFAGCKKLASIVIPNGVTKLNSWNIFSGCENLTSVVLPESLTEIVNAFDGILLRCVIAKCKQVPHTSHRTFSYQTYYHAPLYVRAELYYDYAFDEDWYEFINIKKFVDSPENVQSGKAYFLMNEADTRYIVYDAVNDRLTTRESFVDVDEDNLNDNWTMVKMDGKEFLYNMGAKKFAKRDASEIGFTLVDGVADMNGAAMRKAASVNNTGGNFLFVENGSLSADEKAKDIVAAIEMVTVEDSDNAAIYNISGTEQTSLSRGINIIRSANGKVTKVLKTK